MLSNQLLHAATHQELRSDVEFAFKESSKLMTKPPNPLRQCFKLGPIVSRMNAALIKVRLTVIIVTKSSRVIWGWRVLERHLWGWVDAIFVEMGKHFLQKHGSVKWKESSWEMEERVVHDGDYFKSWWRCFDNVLIPPWTRLASEQLPNWCGTLSNYHCHHSFTTLDL